MTVYGNMLWDADGAHHESGDARLCSKCHDAYLWVRWSASLYKHPFTIRQTKATRFSLSLPISPLSVFASLSSLSPSLSPTALSLSSESAPFLCQHLTLSVQRLSLSLCLSRSNTSHLAIIILVVQLKSCSDDSNVPFVTE